MKRRSSPPSSRTPLVLVATSLLIVSLTSAAQARDARVFPKAGGDRLWLARYNGPGNGNDSAYALEVSPDDAVVYVTGSSMGSTSGQDYATSAYATATGTRLWGARYNGSGSSDDVARALAVSPDGSVVFVTGSSIGSTSGQDYATIAYDAATGALLWGARYNGPANGEDLALDLAVSPGGSAVFVTGESAATDIDYATVAYDAATGGQLWVARGKGPGVGFWDIAYAVGVSPDGSAVFVTGASTEAGGSTYFDYQTIAYDADTGTPLWGARYDSNRSDDVAYALAVSPDGSAVFVTGYSAGSGTDYFTIAYDAATGTKLWAARYDHKRNFDVAYALAVSPDGSAVFVTGRSGEYVSADYLTVDDSTSLASNCCSSPCSTPTTPPLGTVCGQPRTRARGAPRTSRSPSA